MASLIQVCTLLSEKHTVFYFKHGIWPNIGSTHIDVKIVNHRTFRSLGISASCMYPGARDTAFMRSSGQIFLGLCVNPRDNSMLQINVGWSLPRLEPAIQRLKLYLILLNLVSYVFNWIFWEEGTFLGLCCEKFWSWWVHSLFLVTYQMEESSF